MRTETRLDGNPSERAVEAASWGEVMDAGRIGPNNARTILELAHDPALGEDRSVRLGDVLDALREHDFDGPISRAAVDFLAREFSGDPEGGENA